MLGPLQKIIHHQDNQGPRSDIQTTFMETVKLNGEYSAFPQEYVEVLYRILKPGGYWINLGPLLWCVSVVNFSLSGRPSAL